MANKFVVVEWDTDAGVFSGEFMFTREPEGFQQVELVRLKLNGHPIEPSYLSELGLEIMTDIAREELFQ